MGVAEENVLNYNFCDTEASRDHKFGMMVAFKIQMRAKSG